MSARKMPLQQDGAMTAQDCARRRSAGAKPMNLAKLYTWVVGGLFLVAVGFTLAMELVTRGVTLEAGHKAVHVAIGAWAVVIIVKRLDAQYRMFALANGVLWGAVAIVGWTLPDLHGLEAFNRLDTVLHTIVAATGLLSAWLTRQR
jgi:hypothetical protein